MAKTSALTALKGRKSKAGERLAERVEEQLSASKAELQVAEVASRGVKSGRDINIDPSLVRPDPKQPRRHFDSAALRELADTIDSAGQLQPVLVLPIDDDPKYQYQLVAGERRWRAISTLCKKTKTLWAVPVDLQSRRAILEAQIIENDARESTLVMEKALAYAQLVEHYAEEGVKGPAERVCEKLKISKANMSKYRALADQADVLLPLNIKHPSESFVGLYMLASLLKSDQDAAKKRVKQFEAQKGKKSLRALLEGGDEPPAPTGPKTQEGKGADKSGEKEATAPRKSTGTEDKSPATAKAPKRVDDIEFKIDGNEVHITLFMKAGEQIFVTDLGVLEKLTEEVKEEVMA